MRRRPPPPDAQIEMFPARLRLTRVEPEANVHRYYALEVLPDLFGGASLVNMADAVRYKPPLPPPVGTAGRRLPGSRRMCSRRRRRRGKQSSLPRT